MFGRIFKGFKDRIFSIKRCKYVSKMLESWLHAPRITGKSAPTEFPQKEKSGSRSFEEIYQDHVGNNVTI